MHFKVLRFHNSTRVFSLTSQHASGGALQVKNFIRRHSAISVDESISYSRACESYFFAKVLFLCNGAIVFSNMRRYICSKNPYLVKFALLS